MPTTRETVLAALHARLQPLAALTLRDEVLPERLPAAGLFDGWPATAREVTVMDPCCGSGHFLVAAGEMLRKMVPQQHLDFARKLMTDHGVPLAAEGEDNSLQLLGWTEATATPQVEVMCQPRA